jgi:hypothetical protein
MLSLSSSKYGLGSGIRDPCPEITKSGESRMQESKGLQIPDPDLQHCRNLIKIIIHLQAWDQQLLGAAAALRVLGRGRGPPSPACPAHSGLSSRPPTQRWEPILGYLLSVKTDLFGPIS